MPSEFPRRLSEKKLVRQHRRSSAGFGLVNKSARIG